jgi:2-desacetyl-2-hydroxyethyl bacteriochlorophyllide A dehydrogenase
MKATAVVATAVNKIELASVELPEPGPGEVLVEALYSCVSPGTELRCLAGQQRDARFPFLPGYAMVGRVTKVGGGVDVALGTVAFVMGTDHGGDFCVAWGSHMSHLVCSAGKLLPVPDGVDLVQASAAKMASIPYHGVRLCHPLPEEKIAVIGLGAIGHMAAKLYTMSGAHTVACDISPARVEHARANGVNAVKAGDSLKETFKPFFPEGADAVVDCTGVPGLFSKSLDVAREFPWGNHEKRGPRFIVQGSYPDNFTVPYGASFMKELSIHFPRSEQDRDRSIVFDLIKREALSLKSVITEVVSPKDAPRIYESLRDPNTKMMTAVFDWKK